MYVELMNNQPSIEKTESKDADLLQEEQSDLYATVKSETRDDPLYTQTNFEEMEMDEQIGNLLTTSFKKEKQKSSFVKHVPEILLKKKADSYTNLFRDVSVTDINCIEIWEWASNGI